MATPSLMAPEIGAGGDTRTFDVPVELERYAPTLPDATLRCARAGRGGR
jgi:hypothetical protein